jgi:hypothetical protein
MMYPPTIVRFRFENQRRCYSLYLPLYLVLLPVLAIGLLLLPLVLVVGVLLWPTGWGRALLLAGPAVYRLLDALRGLKVDVAQGPQRIAISFQ